MTVTHFVMFDFPSSIPATDVTKVCTDVLALKEKCLDAAGKPYMLSAKGGKNISSEMGRAEFSHGLVMEFADAEALRYYQEEDKVHAAFRDGLMPLVQKGLKGGVVDFEEGNL
ncbi:MAG: hypothetical protein Q9220_004750 [cf. Caloplaca sp. 1 TL-2023]